MTTRMVHLPEPTSLDVFIDSLGGVAEDLTAAAESLQRLSEKWRLSGKCDMDYVQCSLLYVQMLEVTGCLLKRHARELQKSSGGNA